MDMLVYCRNQTTVNREKQPPERGFGTTQKWWSAMPGPDAGMPRVFVDPEPANHPLGDHQFSWKMVKKNGDGLRPKKECCLVAGAITFGTSPICEVEISHWSHWIVPDLKHSSLSICRITHETGPLFSRINAHFETRAAWSFRCLK
jgi:hypothetical protein